jgi:hypothetical protein
MMPSQGLGVAADQGDRRAEVVGHAHDEPRSPGPLALQGEAKLLEGGAEDGHVFAALGLDRRIEVAGREPRGGAGEAVEGTAQRTRDEEA